jgi:hypothetical protein
MPRVAAGERDHPQHPRVRHQVRVQVVLGRQGELEHHLTVSDPIQMLQQPRLQQVLRGGLVRAMDVHLGLDDGHQAGVQNPLAKLELLRDDGGDAARARLLDDRAHLGAEDL